VSFVLAEAIDRIPDKEPMIAALAGQVFSMKKKPILVIDDEITVVRYVSTCLRYEGYQAISAADGQEGLILAEREDPMLVILDIKMPKIDGFEVCRRLREWTQIPIIMLSAVGDEANKVKCLDLGADDYITKPFAKEELLARVRAVLRRTETFISTFPGPPFISDYLKISFAERQVIVADKEVKLTPTEYNLLQEFVLNAGKVLTYSYLLTKVWGPEYLDEHEYLHVIVGRLRKRLEPNPMNPVYIITVPTVGYQFKFSDSMNGQPIKVS